MGAITAPRMAQCTAQASCLAPRPGWYSMERATAPLPMTRASEAMVAYADKGGWLGFGLCSVVSVVVARDSSSWNGYSPRCHHERPAPGGGASEKLLQRRLR